MNGFMAEDKQHKKFPGISNEKQKMCVQMLGYWRFDWLFIPDAGYHTIYPLLLPS